MASGAGAGGWWPVLLVAGAAGSLFRRGLALHEAGTAGGWHSRRLAHMGAGAAGGWWCRCVLLLQQVVYAEGGWHSGRLAHIGAGAAGGYYAGLRSACVCLGGADELERKETEKVHWR